MHVPTCSPAVVCVVAAALVTIISLLVPYWSKIELHSESNSTTNATAADENGSAVAWTTAELTLGVWGSCLSVQSVASTASLGGDSGNSTAASIGSSLNDEDPQEERSLVAASFACASFFITNVYSVSCSRTPEEMGGKCSRDDITANVSLCDADPAPIDLLLMLPKRDQHEQQQLMGLLMSDGGATLDNWERFRSNACSTGGSLARANTALAVTSLSLVGASVIVLLLGITFAAIESRWVKLGRAMTILATILQTTLLALWIIQSRLLTSKCMDFGMSFYLSFVGVVLLVFSSFATRRHLRLERVARRRMEEGHEQLDAVSSKDDDQAKAPNKLEVVLDIDKPTLSTAAAPRSPVSRRASGKRSTYVAV